MKKKIPVIVVLFIGIACILTSTILYGNFKSLESDEVRIAEEQPVESDEVRMTGEQPVPSATEQEQPEAAIADAAKQELPDQVTLIESLKMSLHSAREWAPDAKPYMVHSVDTVEAPLEERSIEGKKENWSVNYYSESKQASYISNVFGGIVRPGVQTLFGTHLQYIDADNLVYDSPELTTYVLSSYHLRIGKGGDEWIHGFQYMLQYGRLADMTEDILYYIFYGISEEGNLANIIVDAESGVILLAKEKYGYDENGRGLWRELEQDAEAAYR